MLEETPYHKDVEYSEALAWLNNASDWEEYTYYLNLLLDIIDKEVKIHMEA